MKSIRKVYVFPPCAALVIALVLAASMTSAETYQYDQVGRLTNVTYDDGSKIDYTYDNAGNIRKIARKGPSVAVRGLADINSNGFPDIALIIQGASSHVHIRDGNTDALIRARGRKSTRSIFRNTSTSNR